MNEHPLSNLNGRRILLASASPRRRELLAMLDVEFMRPDPVEVDESYPASLPLDEVPLYLSRLKAQAYMPTLTPDDVLITADTVVIVDNQVLGKPVDSDDARRMLSMLSGRTHRVVTGVAVTDTVHQQSFTACTEVEFAPLTDSEIDYYVNRFHPLDKAGAYGIQEWIGVIGIKGIKGSFYNVMGLPIHRLYDVLRRF